MENAGRISILGLGLMGGSLGLALRHARYPGARVGYARRPEVREAALKGGVVDEVYAEPADAVRDAGLVILCAPIYTIPELLKSCRDALKPGALVTDVGSTKTELAKTCARILKGRDASFVGSHPIAGSEKQGLDAAVENLYEGAMVVITPGRGGDEARVGLLESFWRSLGADTRVMDPATHDALMARTSHLPHLAAAALALTVGREDKPARTGLFCGTGFRSATRIADGSPDVWLDIVKSNHRALLGELKAYRERLDGFIDALEQADYERIRAGLEEGRRQRRELLKFFKKKQDDA